MNLIDDFSILTWGEKPDDILLQNADEISSLLKSKTTYKREFCEVSTIILCVNPYNIDKFSELDIFTQIINFFTALKHNNILHVKTLQCAILKLLNTLPESFADEIRTNLQSLHVEKIINDELMKKVVSMLDLLHVNKVQTNKEDVVKTPISKPISYQEKIAFFEDILKQIQTVCENDMTNKNIDQLFEKLKNQTFSIGITGVMNAGKSTMLNALLKKEILGTSVVPETANLTIIKYAKTPHAKVNFWTKDEWKRIENSAQFLPSMDEFIKQTKKRFKENLDDFITENGKREDIKSNELSFYTSAKHSDLKCNLVKSVELYEDLEFVKDGVSIVDTPGLDDPVVQREEITKEYLSECDIMIHLMNVNQSATEKDVDFIIDSLTYGHISRLLIVITKIDTVSENELQEVINYTKQSIKKRLESENKQTRFDSIISKIDFLPIAGKLALMHRIGQEKEAKKLGYDLEKTGILQIEAYLKDVLFGSENEKNRLFLDSVIQDIANILHVISKNYMYEKTSLGKSEDELENDFKKLELQNQENKQIINHIKSQIETANRSLKEYFTTLENLLQSRFLTLKGVGIDRICSDVRYELKKHKKKPKDERIKSILETTMKDGIVDILRDYRFEFDKKMQNEISQISFEKSGLTQEEGKVFDTKAYLEKHFSKNFLSGSYAVTNQRVLKALAKTKKDKIDEFAVQLDEILSDTIFDLICTITPSLKKINENLLDGFADLVNKPLDELLQEMEDKKKMLFKHVNLLKTDTQKVTQRVEIINKYLNKLEKIETLLKESKS